MRDLSEYIICAIRLPIAVASVGPASTFLPVYSFVSLFQYASLLPPPIMFISSIFLPHTFSTVSTAAS